MKVDIEPKRVITKTADRRGRITLGSDYGNEEVTVLVLETDKAKVNEGPDQ